VIGMAVILGGILLAISGGASGASRRSTATAPPRERLLDSTSHSFARRPGGSGLISGEPRA